MRSLIKLIALLSICVSSYADSTDHRRFNVLPVPALGYSPETKAYAGFVALSTIDWYNDSQTRVSNAKIELNYTLNRQFIAEAGWNFFTRNEKWFTQGLIHASRYPDQYFGVGYKVGEIEPVKFESNRFKSEISVLKSGKNAWFAGPSLRVVHYGNLKGDSLFLFPELKEDFLLGLGITLLQDKRDNLLNARKGHFIQISASTQKCSHHQYSKIVLDGRTYKTIPKILTLATRFYQQINISEPIYFDQAVAGGDALVRGYFYGMYRNRQLGFVQTELRSFPYKRFGFTVFGGYSLLFNRQFERQDVHLYNYGAGLRILVDKKENINLRIDYGRGAHGQNGFYIAFGEAF